VIALKKCLVFLCGLTAASVGRANHGLAGGAGTQQPRADTLKTRDQLPLQGNIKSIQERTSCSMW